MSAAGARAAAQAATRVLGGTSVAVRLPSPPAAMNTEQLGIPSPEFHDVTVAPCIVRTQRDGSRTVLVDAGTLETALGVSDTASARAALAVAALVQVGTESLLLRETQALTLYGCAYLYRLLLRDAEAEVRA